MAIRIEIEKTALMNALDLAIASAKRAKNTAKKPQFQILYEQDIIELQKAQGSITEIK